MTAPYRRTDSVDVLGNHERRISILEAVAPPAATPSYRNPVNKYVTQGVEWAGNDWYESSSPSVSVGYDAANYGGYIQITADGAYFFVGAPLGPYGSWWTVTLGVYKQPSGGRLELSWQTTAVDGLMAGCRSTPALNSVDGPETNGTTTYRGLRTLTYDKDTYAAVPDYEISSRYQSIWIGGTGGEMLTANGVQQQPDCYTSNNIFEMNGGGDGSVMWWLRLRSNGKNASSSGYNIRLFYVGIVRHEAYTGYQIG